MSIPEVIAFDKAGQAEQTRPGRALIKKFFLTLVILLVAVLSFGVGRLTGGGPSEPIKIEYDPTLGQGSSQAATAIKTGVVPAPRSASELVPALRSLGEVVASKSGSKYHFPSCSGAKQIKEANKITFPSAQAAEAAGYTLAANCSPR